MERAQKRQRAQGTKKEELNGFRIRMAARRCILQMDQMHMTIAEQTAVAREVQARVREREREDTKHERAAQTAVLGCAMVLIVVFAITLLI